MILLLAAAGEGSGQLATGSGTLQVRVGSTTQTRPFTSLEDTTADALDLMVQNGALFSQSIANLNIVFAKTPIVDVQTSAAQENDISTTSQLVTSSATGLLRFQFGVGFKQAPPFVPDGYPVILQVPYSMTDFGTTGVSANVTLRVYDPDGAVFFDETRTFGSDPAEDVINVAGPVPPLEAIEVWLEATAFSNASELTAPATLTSSDAQAIIGVSDFTIPAPNPNPVPIPIPGPVPQAIDPPLLAFDQAAFDATYGAASYVLDDFLVFILSANFADPPNLEELNFQVDRVGDQAVITFNPLAGFNHTVEFNDALVSGPWSELPGAPHNSGMVSETIGPATTTRFYRLRLDVP